MKTVRITEDSHERLTKVAGRLQVARGVNVSLDAAIMTLTSEVFTVSEMGLEFKDLLWKKPAKEETFLWFWGTSSWAKVLQDSYGYDSMMKYAVAFIAEGFSKRLEELGSDVLSPDLFGYFEKLEGTPAFVKRFLKKCGDDGFGNGVRTGKVDVKSLEIYMKLIICYENGKWIKEYIESVQRGLSEATI